MGALEAKPARGGEGVEAAPSVAMRFEPAVLYEAKDAGADQPLGDAEGCEEIDELAEPDGAAVRCDGVSEDCEYKGFGARALDFDEAFDRPFDSLCCAHRLGGKYRRGF